MGQTCKVVLVCVGVVLVVLIVFVVNTANMKVEVELEVEVEGEVQEENDLFHCGGNVRGDGGGGMVGSLGELLHCESSGAG